MKVSNRALSSRFADAARSSDRGVTRANWAELLDWKLDQESDRPIYQQVADFLRNKILSGVLPPSSRLPSSRQLLTELGVSRTTIITAYSQLLADGYIVGHIGSGTYVAHDVINRIDPKTLPVRLPAEARGLSKRGGRYRDVDLTRLVMDNVPFNVGMVRVDGRTSAQLRQLAARKLAVDPSQLGYIDPMGDISLRDEIAKYLGVARGVRCSADQIILVAGTQQAVDLAIKVLLDPGDEVWIEDPAYPFTALALDAAGMLLRPVRVDDDGLSIADGIAAAPNARAAFVTPSHQYPLGVSLSLQRRQQLLDWAARNNAWIVEDDYDSEFRYDGPSLPALQALDRAGRVIYAGSFSKVVFPGLRYGYLVVPPALVGAFTGARALSDRHPPVFFGSLLAEFMERGFFVSHIRRMRNEYRRARDILAGQLKRDIGHLVDVVTPGQGMHLTVYLRDGLSDEQVGAEARREGIMVRPISRLYRANPPRSGLMLGFAGFDEHRLRSAATRLSLVLERLSPRPGQTSGRKHAAI
ncbi:PLP-dependent aminotransferase family protein [Bradyrhizobium canariense]|uniref:Transcriptional regulator, GntR family n=1 Tax=Bradyrhizobium canariense TaxID=255045 RepID=A0A1H1SI57_9BRAD|nr:PLP-dependent aminotransferase family protein [Bradyrhizobium canariense]SDS47416.1 transcriptional regulator, GntR family [Bradyrhizobium canariense]